MAVLTNRIRPWDTIGEPFNGGSKIPEILKGMGMDWKVESRPVLFPLDNMGENTTINLNNLEVPKNYRANIRNSDNFLMGIVSDKYEIIQNDEAFSFLDYMIPEGLEIDRGGIINDKKVWLTGKFGSFEAAGDVVDNYVIFTNSHDGKGSIKVCITPVRALCQNTLSLAFEQSFRSWSIAHISTAKEKLVAAEVAMERMHQYMRDFKDVSLILANKKLSDDAMLAMLDKLIPLDVNRTEQKERAVLDKRAQIVEIYKNAPDLGRGTAWDFLNAVSDYATHYIPDYNEQLYRNSNMSKIIQGHPLIDRAFELVSA